jgi:hypothetical protein
MRVVTSLLVHYKALLLTTKCMLMIFQNYLQPKQDGLID